ncbi:MAG: hypothetical protein AAGC60_23245 [Acidobacteriota bacterium]
MKTSIFTTLLTPKPPTLSGRRPTKEITMHLKTHDLRSICREATSRLNADAKARADEQGKRVAVRTGLRAGGVGESAN